MTRISTLLTGTALLALLAGWTPAIAEKMSAQQVQARLEQMDVDKDQRLSYQEIIDGYGAKQSGRLKYFQKLDKDGSGAIEPAELPKGRKMEKLDINKNGAVNKEEFLIAHSTRMREFVMETDTDRDGFVTSDELGKKVMAMAENASTSYEEIANAYMANPGRRQKLFRKLDRDDSGSIDAKEWPDANTFGAADQDGNGQIGNDEFMNAHAKVSQALLESLDSNRDGKISGLEFRKARG